MRGPCNWDRVVSSFDQSELREQGVFDVSPQTTSCILIINYHKVQRYFSYIEYLKMRLFCRNQKTSHE